MTREQRYRRIFQTARNSLVDDWKAYPEWLRFGGRTRADRLGWEYDQLTRWAEKYGSDVVGHALDNIYKQGARMTYFDHYSNKVTREWLISLRDELKKITGAHVRLWRRNPYEIKEN